MKELEESRKGNVPFGGQYFACIREYYRFKGNNRGIYIYTVIVFTYRYVLHVHVFLYVGFY